MVREDTAEDAKLPPLPSTCETRRTPPRTKCSEQYWHTVVRTTDPTVSKFLPFLFQNAPGIVLQRQTLLASLLFTNDRQVSSLGQRSRCPGHPGTWHSTEWEEGRWQSLAEQWDGLRSCPTCQGVLVARFSQNTTPKKRSVAPTFLLIACSSFWWEQGPAVSQPNCEQLGNTRDQVRTHCVFNRVAAISLPESFPKKIGLQTNSTCYGPWSSLQAKPRKNSPLNVKSSSHRQVALRCTRLLISPIILIDLLYPHIIPLLGLWWWCVPNKMSWLCNHNPENGLFWCF